MAAQDKYNILDPEDEVVCPYDKAHKIRAKRLPYHLMKCRRQQKNNPESQYYKGCTDMPSYRQADEDLPPPTENWDKECPTAIRIGVDPNYLYSSSKIVNPIGLAPSQKKRLSKYFMSKPNAEDGQTAIQNIIDSNHSGTDDTQQNGDRVRLPRTTPALLEQVEKHRIAAHPPYLYANPLSSAGVGRGRGRGITTPNAHILDGLGGAANAGTVDNAQLMLAMSRGRGLMKYNTVSAPGGLIRASDHDAGEKSNLMLVSMD